MTFPEIKMNSILRLLHRIENRIETDFLRANGRGPTINDKIAKVIEELGEVKQEAKHGHGHAFACEVWDSAIATISIGFLAGLQPEAMLDALDDTLTKLRERHLAPEA